MIMEAPCWGFDVCILWFIGLGIGTEPDQMTAEQAVVDYFNAVQKDRTSLIIEDVPYNFARDTILTQIAANNGPDIIGPVSLPEVNILHGQWLDLGPLLAANPAATQGVDPALLNGLKTSDGQIGVPISVYSSAMFYNTDLFDKAGLNYPPTEYGLNLGPATYILDGRQVTWDWDTVREVARRLTLDANGRNAAQPGFDRSRIAQYGFSWNYQTDPSNLGSFWGSGSYTEDDGQTAQLPEAWQAAWAWTYDGMWGGQPFIPTGAVANSADYDNGNQFNSGKVGMTEQLYWYTCCMEKLKTWDVGVLPAYQGKVSGRADEEFLGMWKGTRIPKEAFQALTYLVTTAHRTLAIGTATEPPVYGDSVPFHSEDQPAWLAARQAQFPWVRHWDVFITDLGFVDAPSAESYMPNFDKAWQRGRDFYNLMAGTGGLDLAKEEQTFQKDLQAIFEQKP